MTRSKKSLPFEMSDGGRRAAGFDREKNDCSVRALAHVADISYSEAHEYMRRSGRKHGREGQTFAGLDLMSREGKVKVTRLPVSFFYWGASRFGSCPTLNQVMRVLSKRIDSRYLVIVRKHAFAIVDGVIKDSAPLSGVKRITHLFEVTPVKRELSREDVVAAWNRLINLEADILT